jgi:hypothetical protein
MGDRGFEKIDGYDKSARSNHESIRDALVTLAMVVRWRGRFVLTISADEGGEIEVTDLHPDRMTGYTFDLSHFSGFLVFCDRDRSLPI